MSTSANLPDGAFITSINGKRCTAVPRTDGSKQQTSTAATTSTTEAAQETATTTSEQDQQQQTTTSQQVESTSTSSTTTSSSSSSSSSSSFSSSTTSPASTTQIIAPPPAQTSEDPPPTSTRIDSSPPPGLAQGPSTTQVAVAPAVTTPSDAASMGSFSLIPETSDSNSSTIGGTQTRAQTQATAPVNSIATSAIAVADSIITDPNVASTTAAAESSVDSTSVETPLAENGGESSPGAGNAIFTTLRTSTATTGTEASITAGQPTVTAIANSSNNGTTIAIVGGVVGGIAIASFLAFLLWFWRKRSLQKRQSTLLTPLSADPSFRRDEKGYVIDRGSVGPTPITERLRADISSNFARVRGRLSSFLGRRGDTALNVNLNRGHSQFMEPLPQHSRSSSRRSSRAGLRGGKLTTKDRFIDWWDRLTEDVNFNWRLRNERNSPELDPFLAARDIKEKNDTLAASNQPDFLTLLGMDDNQLERKQMKRASGHGQSGSGSSGHFLGGLGLNLDGRDPFADTPRDSAKPAPLVVSGPSNPFSDANAIPSAPASTIPKPTTYVAEVRRSRGSVSAGSGPTAGGIAASGVRRSRADSYRESLQSVESFATRRNKFRSDPFDLERPELLVGRQKSSSSNTNTTRNEVRTPKMAHSRNDSFTSKYTSSTSFADWSDPGPDVGPAATRWDGGSDGRDSPSERSVGKAM